MKYMLLPLNLGRIIFPTISSPRGRARAAETQRLLLSDGSGLV